MQKQTVCLLGLGEVGTAVGKVLSKKFKVLKKDLEIDEVGGSQVDFMHVCIPYSKKFLKIVTKQTLLNKPKLIVIHSTILPGTARLIFNQTKTPTVHSPVMGVHPYLDKHILSFKKVIGPVNKKSAAIAAKHFRKAGFKIHMFKKSEDSELGKILDTTYYGWNIIFNKLVYQICHNKNIDFNSAYTEFNKIYNNGYRLIKPNVVRPVLSYQEGQIGGHCIIPNVEILEQFTGTDFGRFILKQNKKFKN